MTHPIMIDDELDMNDVKENVPPTKLRLLFTHFSTLLQRWPPGAAYSPS